MKPQFSDLNDFLNMGGYAAYVFPAWALAFIIIFGLIIFANASNAKWQKRVKDLQELIKNEKN